MRPYLSLLLVLALTAGSGALAGVLGSRWQAPPDTLDAAARLDRLPATFGEWELIDEMPFEESAAVILECARSSNRSYRHRESGETVHMAIFVGPPGPTSVHTPEICYSSQGFHLASSGQRRKYRPTASEAAPADAANARSPSVATANGPGGAANHEFRKTVFLPDVRRPLKLIVYYGWCSGRLWQAPEQPRFSFGGLPYLYKIQLAAQVVTRLDQEDADPCDEFLGDFLPALAHSGFYSPSESQ